MEWGNYDEMDSHDRIAFIAMWLVKYQEIIDQNPDSSYSKVLLERLDELEDRIITEFADLKVLLSVDGYLGIEVYNSKYKKLFPKEYAISESGIDLLDLR